MGRNWRIVSYSPKFFSPIFIDTLKMYLAYSPNSSLLTAFTCIAGNEKHISTVMYSNRATINLPGYYCSGNIYLYSHNIYLLCCIFVGKLYPRKYLTLEFCLHWTTSTCVHFSSYKSTWSMIIGCALILYANIVSVAKVLFKLVLHSHAYQFTDYIVTYRYPDYNHTIYYYNQDIDEWLVCTLSQLFFWMPQYTYATLTFISTPSCYLCTYVQLFLKGK